jgi:hypothetical protein
VQVDEIMHHWTLLRKKSMLDTAKRNLRLEKVQGGDNINKIVQSFLEALSREQCLFGKLQIRNRHRAREQELKSFLRYETPGPGQYLGPGAGGLLKPVRGFTMSRLRTMPQSRHSNPGPGDYDVPGGTGSGSQRGGGFSTANPKTYIEQELYRARDIPGPGTYRTPTKAVSGGKFRVANPPSVVQQAILRGKATPGPGEYMNPDRPEDVMAPFLQELERVSREHLQSFA